MKLRVKFITIAIVITFATIMFNSLVAVGNVYQTIASYGNSDKLSLIYRTVVAPHGSTITDFRNCNAKYGEWTTCNDGNKVEWGTYKSNYVVYTNSQIGKYTASNSVNIGYAQFNITDEGNKSFTSSKGENVANWINTAR